MLLNVQLIIILFCICHNSLPQATSAGSRSAAGLIAEQLGHGIKRAVYYMDMLLEKCDNIEDLNQWILFMDSYLKCDVGAQPKKLQEVSFKDPIERLSTVCAAWPKRRKCSSKLASKLNSCLGFQLQDGRAGTNALNLADAQMKYICHHKREYARSLEDDYISPIEKRPLTCFREIKVPVANCISEELVLASQDTFCGNFILAKRCLMRATMQYCKNQAAKDFMHAMLKQLHFDAQCSSINEIDNV